MQAAKYLNSGFLMGTASAVADALRCALAQAARLPVVDDQHALTLCMLERPDLLTLDYAGRIALALGGIDLRRALALRGSGAGSRRQGAQHPDRHITVRPSLQRARKAKSETMGSRLIQA